MSELWDLADCHGEKDSVFVRILVAIRSYVSETEAAPDILKIIRKERAE